MAITTLSGLKSGLQYPRHFCKVGGTSPVAGKIMSLWASTGFPAAGTYDNTLNGIVHSSTSAEVTGQVPFTDPNSGSAYLARFQVAATQSATSGGIQLMLCDRLWSNGNIDITSTSAQNITSPTWPARDEGGATTGTGVLLALSVSATTGAGTPTITVSYTNTASTAGRTGTNILATTATTILGTFIPISLQAGDVGVKSVESITLDQTWSSGTINLIAYRVLGMLELNGYGKTAAFDGITGALPKMYNGSVPFMTYVPAGTGQMTFTGEVQYSWG